jgi:hypothetical protein
MSSLWQPVDGAGWQPVPPGRVFDFPGGAARLVLFGQGAEGGAALLVLPGSHIRVNGLPILGGLRVLEHTDELLVNGLLYYFSAESRPECVAFALKEGDRRPTCPVCRGPVQDGEQAVGCPGCGRWYHQIEAAEGRRGRNCWTYAPSCRFCTHPTSLSGEPVWRPEQEESHV